MDNQTNDDDLVLEEGDLLLELVRSIVRNPAKVEVQTEQGKDTTLLIVTVDPSDRGHVIGRERRTLAAIEHLFTKAAYIDGRRVVIQLSGQDVPRVQRPPRQRPQRGRR